MKSLQVKKMTKVTFNQEFVQFCKTSLNQVKNFPVFFL